MRKHRALPAGLGFGFRHSFLFFLIARFPAILDSWQQFSNLFDVLLTPKAHLDTSDTGKRWQGNFLCSNVPVECRKVQPQVLCNFASGISFHLATK